MKSKENNQGSSKGGSSTPHPSNTGSSTKLHNAPAGGAPGTVGTMGPVTNKNCYPKGLS
jgi:hypothetical protein